MSSHRGHEAGRCGRPGCCAGVGADVL